MALYDRLGIGYDATRRADPYLVTRLLAHLRPLAGGRYLDAGCGTGNYASAIAASAPGIAMIGADISERMISAAKAKDAIAPVNCPHWLVSDVAALPFERATFAGVVCTLAIHHFPSLDAAVAEIGRVVDDATGRLVILTSTPEQMERYWLRRYFPETLARSAMRMPPFDAVAKSMRAAGFACFSTEPYSVRPDLQDFFLYSGKFRPAMYLVPNIRAGMSSFADLAPLAEVETGCAWLRRDIEAGRIDRIIVEAEYSGGDYLFIVGER